MTEKILAVYEGDRLRPLEPLALKEGQRVYITLVAQETDEDEREAVVRVLREAGLLVPRPEGPVPPDPLSKEEREALAIRAGRVSGKTASEMVIEDRGER